MQCRPIATCLLAALGLACGSSPNAADPDGSSESSTASGPSATSNQPGSDASGEDDRGSTSGETAASESAEDSSTGGPEDVEPADTEFVTSITHDEVTIDFAAPTEVGHFIDGYPFVVGTTTITGYTPAPATLEGGRVVNGCMLNPSSGTPTGLDSNAGADYDPALNCGDDLPLTFAPGDRMLIAVSDETIDDSDRHLSRVVLLTAVDDIPPADAFRPAFADSSFDTVFRFADLRTELLQSLPVVGSPPSWEEVNARFERFSVDIAPNWNRGHFETFEHQPIYGRDLSGSEGAAYLMVNADYTLEEKRIALIGLVQRGIDRYGTFRSAIERDMMPWRADGGHNSGRKFSIMFAGALLDVPEMQGIVEQTGRPRDMRTSEQFQEDAMTFHVEQYDIDETNGPNWDPSYDDRPHQPYAQAMLGMPDWRGSVNVHSSDASWTGHAYRMSTNAGSQHGQALAALVMGLREDWGNDAYFDYHARYVEIMSSRPDPWGTLRGPDLSYPPVTGSTPAEGWPGWQQHWNNAFAWEMVQTYWYDFYEYPW